MYIGFVKTFHCLPNAAIVGDLLTTVGSKVLEDMEKVKKMGFSV